MDLLQRNRGDLQNPLFSSFTVRLSQTRYISCNNLSKKILPLNMLNTQKNSMQYRISIEISFAGIDLRQESIQTGGCPCSVYKKLLGRLFFGTLFWTFFETLFLDGFEREESIWTIWVPDAKACQRRFFFVKGDFFCQRRFFLSKEISRS